MATSFKSNRAATVFIKDVAGYKGPADFIFNADFSNEIYLKKSGAASLSEILTSTRNSASSILLNAELEHRSVQANQLRRSYIPDYGTYGILADLSNEDRLENPDWAQVYLPDAIGNSVWSIYALQGSATLSSTDVVILSGLGTLESPQYFKYKNTQYPKISRLDGAKAVCCVAVTPFYQTPFIPYFNSITSVDERLNIAANFIKGASGTAIIRYLEPKRQIPLGQGIVIEKPLLKLEANNLTYFALAKQQHTEKLVARYFINGSEAGFLPISNLIAKNTGINTVAVTWQKGVFNVAVNGSVIQLAGLSMGSTFSVTAATVLSIIDGWISRSSNNALLNLITYDRALSTSELTIATDF